MSAPVAEGQVLSGKYRVERILGQGGMGVVLAAMHEHLHQRVAIKLLHPGASAELVERFEREARAAVRLKSEHVARVLDVGTLETGAPFMVMEYLEGSDLQQTLRDRGPLEVEEAVGYVLEACEAIAEAHAAGIIHRDLKPANLFLTRGADGSDMVKVLDFGISKALADPSAAGGEPALGLTRTAMVLGSPLYMAPEQMRSARSVDARADIWSIGAVLYQLLTCRVPFEATSLSELILMINGDPPPPPSTHRPDLPPGLEAAILRCLEKDTAKRFRSVAELASAIVDFGPPLAVASLERIERTLGLVPAVPWRDRASSLRDRMSQHPGAAAPDRASGVPAATAPAGARKSSVAPPGVAASPAGTAPGWTAAGAAGPAAGGRRRRGVMLALAGVGVAAVLGGVLRVITFQSRPEDPASQQQGAASSAEPSAPATAPPVVQAERATAPASAAPPDSAAAPASAATPAAAITPVSAASVAPAPAASAAPTPAATTAVKGQRTRAPGATSTRPSPAASSAPAASTPAASTIRNPLDLIDGKVE
ncbi:protein kinase [Sorangium cellulosum]|uniref:Protein kinase n=1 Tax=Sorangium cellulosum TaxID=56 RepID=A0A2L0ERD7_SORCE|nr:serine/threonine-protein kinase [Sorangium cellulosum]AUX41844.1 protein kinase [Sorangium cellulosum]